MGRQLQISFIVQNVVYVPAFHKAVTRHSHKSVTEDRYLLHITVRF